MLLLQLRLMEHYGHGEIMSMDREDLMLEVGELVEQPDLHQFKYLVLHGGVEYVLSLQQYIQKLMEHCGHVDQILMGN